MKCSGCVKWYDFIVDSNVYELYHLTADRSLSFRIFCIKFGSQGNDCLHDPLPRPIIEAFKQSNVSVFSFFINFADNQLIPRLEI